MKFKYRKPITSSNPEQVGKAISAHFGKEGFEYPLEFYVGNGWSDIVSDLNKKLEAEKSDYELHQIKEKFGTLRYYIGPMTEQGHEYVVEAERLSAVTCEECGRPGELRDSNGWVKTLCSLDSLIDRVNTHLWGFHRRGLTTYFKIYFAYRRLNRKRKESAKNGI